MSVELKMHRTKAPVVRRNSCRLCENRNLRLVLQLTPTPIGDAFVSSERITDMDETFPLDIFLCLDCGHIQLLDVIDSEILKTDPTYMSYSTFGLVEHFKKMVGELLSEYNPPTGGNVIVIGSNDGALPELFKQKGMQILGIEAERSIAKKAKERGIRTCDAPFTMETAQKIKNEFDRIDMVIGGSAHMIFANIDDLVSLTDAIRYLLSKDSVFVFEVNYLLDLIQMCAFDNFYHAHLSYHSVKPLRDFFHNHGMELFDVQHLPIKGGSLRCSVQLVCGRRPMSASVAKMIALETDLGLYRLKTFDAFSNRVDSLKNGLSALLRSIDSQGKTIVGYGSSLSTTTLIYHLRIARFLNFIVDDNPARHNLFSPGKHIPIHAPEEIYNRRPDYILILAWRYAETIVKKHQEFRNHGGRFIVPLPETRVI